VSGSRDRFRSGRSRAVALIIRRSLRRHALSTFVSVLSVALASGLVMSIWSLQTESYRAFTGGGEGFDAVVGGRGSPLQLVLNAVFHLETSPGNIPWSLYKSLSRDPRVRLAVPYAVGDNYRGLRIVGTTSERFAPEGPRREARLRLRAGGRLFGTDLWEAVLGDLASRRTGLKVGDRFHPAHGLTGGDSGGRSGAAPGTGHREEYTVTGILEPTGGPSDRVIWVPIETVLRMSGHVLRGAGVEYEARDGEPIPEEHREISAVCLRLKGPQAGFSLDEEINRWGRSATFAWPISQVMADLFQKLGWANRVLLLVAYLVALVAAGVILTSIHNSMHERRRDLAILRLLGAGRRVVFSAVLGEAAVIAGLGSIAGVFVWGAIMAAAAATIRAQTGVWLPVIHFHPILVLTPPCMVLLGAVAGLLPAGKAYATDVVETLDSDT
jgi:putative ABC transport system permease protein